MTATRTVTMAWDHLQMYTKLLVSFFFFLSFFKFWLNHCFLRTMMTMTMMTNSHHHHMPSSSPTPSSGWVGAQDVSSDTSQAFGKFFLDFLFFWPNQFQLELRTTMTNSHHMRSSSPSPTSGWTGTQDLSEDVYYYILNWGKGQEKEMRAGGWGTQSIYLIKCCDPELSQGLKGWHISCPQYSLFFAVLNTNGHYY